MGLQFQVLFVALASVSIVSGASAQERKRGPTSAAVSEMGRPTLTGKERLGRKWTDEQRIDNCHVPVEKRGIRSRPSACPNDPSS